jgi:alpha-glucosidase
MAAVYYSPLQFLFWYDLPYPDGWDGAELQFWRDCPTVFDESRALDGELGEYIVQARRKGDEWFVGAMTNTEARSINVPTNFLQRGRKYIVTLYTDDPTLSTRSKVAVHRMQVKAGKSIPLQLMASGGAAIHFKPSNKK